MTSCWMPWDFIGPTWLESIARQEHYHQEETPNQQMVHILKWNYWIIQTQSVKSSVLISKTFLQIISLFLFKTIGPFFGCGSSLDAMHSTFIGKAIAMKTGKAVAGGNEEQTFTPSGQTSSSLRTNQNALSFQLIQTNIQVD